MKQKLLFINIVPLGYLTDLVKWCEYLKNNFDITLICFEPDNGQYTSIDGIKVKYVSYKGNKSIRGVRYILYCLWNILFFKGHIFIEYFEHCHIFKIIFPLKKMILDIRTLSTALDTETRKRQNINMVNSIKKFDKVCIISLKLLEKLNLKIKPNIFELPLGADVNELKQRDNKKLNLLYVGGLFGRDIEKTIYGISIFLKKYPNVNLQYTIIGKERHNEIIQLKEIAKSLKIESYINFIPGLPHSELKSYFQECNIGISFVPITEYFNLQPPTKTFEYVLSGMICLATNTTANKEIIQNSNGVLHDDNSEDFAKGLEYVYNNINNYNSETIQASLLDYSWSNIVKNTLIPILEN